MSESLRWRQCRRYTVTVVHVGVSKCKKPPGEGRLVKCCGLAPQHAERIR